MPEFRPRLYLVTPPLVDPESFVPRLDAALSGGDVAALLIDVPGSEDRHLEDIARVLTPVIQAHDVAAIIAGDSRVAGRVGADGLHVVGSPATIRAAIEWVRPKNLIVGAGDIETRDMAMMLGELDVDYLFFGRLDGPETARPSPQIVALAGWWAELFEIPGVILGGTDLASVATAVETSSDFIALRSAIWECEAGPAAAVAKANRLIDEVMEATS